MFGIQLQLPVVEIPNSIGVGERYHEPLRRVFRKLRLEHPDTDREMILRYAVKGINYSVVPDGFVPAYLIYGTFPSFPVTNADIPSQKERMTHPFRSHCLQCLRKALETMRREMASINAELRIWEALLSRLPCATRHDLNPGDRVLMYKEGSHGKYGEWIVLFQILRLADKQELAQRPDEIVQHNLTHVMPEPADTEDRSPKRLVDNMRQFTSGTPPGVLITEAIPIGSKRGNSEVFDQGNRRSFRD